MERVARYNGMENPDVLREGQVLYLPEEAVLEGMGGAVR